MKKLQMIVTLTTPRDNSELDARHFLMKYLDLLESTSKAFGHKWEITRTWKEVDSKKSDSRIERTVKFCG